MLRFIIGAGGLAAYWASGPVAAAFTMLAGYAYSKKLDGNRVVPMQAPARPLDPSVYLFQPKGQAARIRNDGNSCAFSSVLWNLANMPEILGELPLAIARRLNQIERLADPTIQRILQKRGPLQLADFEALRIALIGYEARPECKELLSLLQLHDLIREFQTTDEMLGARVNDFRTIIYRMDPTFEATGIRMGDAHDIFMHLAEPIFRNSRLEQQFHFTNNLGNPSRVSNWGHLELPLNPDISIADTMLEYLNTCNGQFNTAPQLLALNLKRNDFTYVEGKENRWIPTITMLFHPVKPSDTIQLGPDYFRDRRGARYQLVGVSRRLEGRAHYDATWKRPGGQWYYGDDLNKVYSISSEEARKTAAQGYLFFYRKIS
ncbi:MAG: hypothetical protein K1X28_06595 [Parachlamydiales bacterium]|nr:hypothetical protein [Parachlamydiales bacterium]